MSEKVTISIVIPVYNEERYLRACLQSIAVQTQKPDEVIIVNNNSTDNSLNIAREFDFVQVIHEKTQGITYARDKGFDSAKSEIIGRIDGDSVLPSNWVARVKQFYSHDKHKKTALTGGAYFYNVRAPRINGWLQSQLAFRTNRIISGFYILWGSNMAIPKAFWKEVKASVCRRDDIHEDMDLAIHLHQHNYHIHYLANLRVGAVLKRFWTDRKTMHKHMRRWPLTLRVHGFRLWWFGSIGNVFLTAIIQPTIIIAEYLSRLIGRPSLK